VTLSGFGFFELQHFGGRALDRLDDVRVARATAEIAVNGVADVLARWIRVVLKELDGGHDHPRRAVTTLEAVAFPEAFLYWVQLSIAGEALDGGYFAAIGLNCEECAGLDGLAIKQNGASAAQRGFAADMRAGKLALVAEEVDEQGACFDFLLMEGAIDADGNGGFHKSSRTV
jgi:hypothetical protein